MGVFEVGEAAGGVGGRFKDDDGVDLRVHQRNFPCG